MSTYIVKKGETLSGIGQQLGVNWRKITGFRSGDPNLIYPGEALTIPGAAPTAGTIPFQTQQQLEQQKFTPYTAPTPVDTTIRADDLATQVAPVVEPELGETDIPTVGGTGGGGFWTGTEMLYDEAKIAEWKGTHPGGYDPSALAPTGAGAGDGTPTDDTSNYLKTYLESIEPPVDPTTAYKTAQEEAGIKEKQEVFTESQRAIKAAQSELDIVNAQIADIVGQTQVRKLEIAKEPISAGAIRGRNIVEERNLAIRAIPLQAQALVAQANIASAQGDEIIAQNALSMAQDSLDKVFGMQLDYQENLRNYNNDLRAMVYEYVDKKEQQLLDAQEKEDDRAYDLMRDQIDNAQSVAKGLLQTQPTLAAKVSQIDWSQPDAMNQFVTLQAQITPDPMTSLNIAVKQAQLVKLRKETELLGAPSATETKATTEALKNAEASIPIMRDKVNLVDSLLTHKALDSRVGPTRFSRKDAPAWYKPTTWFGEFDDLTGAGDAFAGDVARLVSGLSLDSLIEAKARGATFGALSDAEMMILSQAATSIANWELKDKNGIGLGIWDVSETKFKEELNRIKDLTNRALFLAEGTLIDPEEQSLLDDIYNDIDGQAPSTFY